MLKIKDKVDLKELEKFGFVYEENYEIKFYSLDVCKKNIGFDGFRVYVSDREINNYSIKNDTLDILYDLIQAGIVEKV